MTGELLFLCEITVLLLFFYFVFSGRTAEALYSSIILFKLNILFIIMSPGSPGPAVLAAVCGLFALATAVFIAVSYENKTRLPLFKKEYTLVIMSLVLLALFMNGCSFLERENLPKLVGEIKLDYVPGKIFINGKNEFYVCAEKQEKVMLYDLRDKTLKKTIATQLIPSDMLMYDKKIYVANKGSRSITVYDQTADKSENYKCGGGQPAALARDNTTLFCANAGSDNVSFIDLCTMKVMKTIATGKWPSFLYFFPQAKNLYVACKYTNTIDVIDIEKEKHVFTKINTGISPVKIIPLRNGELAVLNEWVYAFNNKSAVIFLDMKTYAVKRSINVTGGLCDGILSKSGNYLYISDPVSDTLKFIDIKTKKQLQAIGAPGAVVKWLALSQDGKYLFVSCQGQKKILIIAVRGLS